MKEGAPCVGEGRTKWRERSAKCWRVGCHLSTHYHNSPSSRFERIWGAPPLKRLAAHMGMRHLSRGVHPFICTCSNTMAYAINYAFDPSYIILWAPPRLLCLYFAPNMSPHVFLIWAFADFFDFILTFWVF
jgi:hypothetical protein